MSEQTEVQTASTPAQTAIVRHRLDYEMTAASIVITLLAVDSNENATAVKSATYDVNAVPEILMDGDKPKSVRAYGLMKLMQDRNSGLTNAIEKFEGMALSYSEQFVNGLWKAPSEGRASSPRKPSLDTFLVQAVADLRGISIAIAASALQKASAEERKAVAANERVMARVAELKAEAESTTASEALGDLLG